MPQIFNNYAFIDGQNLHLGTREAGWIPDYGKLREYLRNRYNVGEAFYFIGYKDDQKALYASLTRDGYNLIHKPTYIVDGDFKGNCDAELVLHCMIQFNNFNKAVIISGDGDFYCLINHLREQAKLRMVIIPNKKKISELLPVASKGQMCYMDDLKNTMAFALL
jgi:uncharacterized LabA/DUF88 family protein